MYPWFFLARVTVYPYQIQQSAVLPMSDEVVPLSRLLPQRQVPLQTIRLYRGPSTVTAQIGLFDSGNISGRRGERSSIQLWFCDG